MITDALALLGLFAAILATIYALCRFGLYVQRHGFLYHRDAPSSGGSAFLPLQELIEPQIQHVEQVKEQRLKKADDESGSGSDKPN